jgi:hypothetical protein
LIFAAACAWAPTANAQEPAPTPKTFTSSAGRQTEQFRPDEWRQLREDLTVASLQAVQQACHFALPRLHGS